MIKNFYLSSWLLTGFLTICSGSSTVFVMQSSQMAYAKESAPIHFNSGNLQVPASIGEPKGRGAGGRRGCNADDAEDQLIPLVPTLETSDRTIRWGLTTSAYPTLWLHSPKGFQNGALVWLSVSDSTSNVLYRIPFQVPKTTSGVLQFVVPSTVTPLQLNTPYRWQLTVYCNSGNDNLTNLTFDTPFTIMGGIQRVIPSTELKQQLAIAKTPLEQAISYAKNSIWYDSLTLLGNSIQNKSAPNNDTFRAWIELLQQVDLGKSASATFIKCCTPQKSQ